MWCYPVLTGAGDAPFLQLIFAKGLLFLLLYTEITQIDSETAVNVHRSAIFSKIEYSMDGSYMTGQVRSTFFVQRCLVRMLQLSRLHLIFTAPPFGFRDGVRGATAPMR